MESKPDSFIARDGTRMFFQSRVPSDNPKLVIALLHGTDDRITSPEGSVVFEKNGGGNVTLRLLDGFFHELHNELGMDEVFNLIMEWLKENAG
jgi:alpha-beta hydrolase superfamily lysophospholipase